MHPRLFYTNNDFERIKTEAASGGLRDDALKLVIADADKSLASEIPEFNSSGENLWINELGKKLPNLSAAYRFTGNKEYFNKALAITEALLSYPYWATDGAEDGTSNELAASGAFLGISLFWDWCYDEIGAEKRAEILPELIARGESMLNFGWYRAAYLQNHLHQCAGSLLISAFAIYDEYEGASSWISTANTKFESIMKLLPGDGGAAEGHMYFDASASFLTMAGILNEKFMNINMLDGEFFKNASSYAVYNTLPMAFADGGTDQFYFGDAPFYSRYVMGNFVSYLSGRFNDYGGKKYVRDCLEKKKTYSLTNNADWMMLRYLDTEFATLPYGEIDVYPTDYLFNETGYAYSRESFEADSDMLAIHSGPALGSLAAEKRESYTWDLGIGHQHPDNGHFQLMSDGWWIFKDDGYTKGATKAHNTVLINGLGQYGDSETREALGIDSSEWHKKWTMSAPEILSVKSYDGYSVITADVTEAYPSETGLASFIRTYVYLKDSKALVVIDKLKASEESEFSIRFRPCEDFWYNTELGTGKYRFYAKESTNGLYLLVNFITSPETASVGTEPLPYGKNGAEFDYYIAKNSVTAEETTHITALSWANRLNGDTPAEVTVTESDGIYNISVGDKTYNINLN